MVEFQRDACLIGQEDVTGRSSLVISCKELSEYWNVHRTLRRAARMVNEEEGVMVGIYSSREKTPVFAGVSVETGPVRREVKAIDNEVVNAYLRGKGITPVE